MNGFMEEMRALVGNERGFVHKKLLGGISKLAGVASFIPGASTVSAITGKLAGRTVPRSQVARVTKFSQAEKQFGRQVKFESEGAGPSLAQRFGRFAIGAAERFAGQRTARPTGIAPPTFPPIRGFGPKTGDCPEPLILSPQGNCIAPTSPRGAELFFGEATMGRYGAALIPGSQIIDRATCPRGAQLGNDGLCYNKGQITNKQRMWPAGAKPLLTGGQMNAIRIADRARTRVARTAVRLGIEPKARRRRAPAGHKAKLVHA